MKKIYFLIMCTCSLMITFSSCTEDTLTQNESSGENKNVTVEQSNVLNLIKEFANSVNSENALRSSSGDEFTVETITKKTYSFDMDKNIVTKSTSQYIKDVPDNATIDLYTVIFTKGDKKGFSIASADEKVERVYAYTESGQLSDTTYNFGLSLTLSAIPSIIEQDLNKYYGGVTKQRADSLREEMYGTVNIGPLLGTEWNQTFPYNRYCPGGCEWTEAYQGLCPAGCVAITMAQVMNCSLAPGFTPPHTLSTTNELTDGYAREIHLIRY